MSIIRLNNVSKFYYNKTSISSGFTKLNLELDMGEFVVITGESGSGKSTLLNVISGLDSYEEGEMYINGEETSHYTEVDYENYRRKYIGNIFQHFNLVNSYTVYQNVELVLLLNGYKRSEVKEKILGILKTVGLSKYKNTKASKLSGGQKQRVAIARALAKDTPIIVADEPTGNLDMQSAKSIMKLLKEISANKLVVIVTHNYELVEDYATRKISMNDGKIIEDKKYEKVKTVEPELVKYKDLTNINKFILGFRNAFNIKAKFALLFLVYFFLTLFVFSEYSSLRKQEYDESLDGFNYYFSEVSPNRVILSKKDKTMFTDAEISTIEKMDNVEKVEEDDLLLDMDVSVYNDDVYFYGVVKSINELKEVDEGEIPDSEDEIVVEGHEYSYYFDIFQETIINKEMTLQNNYNGTRIDTVKISGIRYAESDNLYGDYTIYVSEDILEQLRLSLGVQYSGVALTINDKKFIKDEYKLYYDVQPNKNVKDGEAYGFEEMNVYCANYNCNNKKISLSVDNIYYTDSIDLTVKKILTKDNFKSNTGLSNFDEYYNTLFVSENDYKNLFIKGTYQISAFLEDTRVGDEVISNLRDMGYDTYYMKENLISVTGDFIGIINIIRNVVFLIATIALFFISYFIIKIILKSRNVYFSTIRILGATKSVAKQLLNIELFIDANIAYFAFAIIIATTRLGFIQSAYITDLVSYFTLIDYIAVYLILILMSILISNRYARKLFKDSVMSTYREEV